MFDIPIEAQMNTAIYEYCPDIPEALRRRGDEILGHGATNSDEQGGLDEATEEAHLSPTSPQPSSGTRAIGRSAG